MPITAVESDVTELNYYMWLMCWTLVPPLKLQKQNEQRKAMDG